MKDRRWATQRDRGGARLLEYVLVTIAVTGLSLFVVEAVGGIAAAPLAATAATLERMTTMAAVHR
mgnify:CR=1 FL=1